MLKRSIRNIQILYSMDNRPRPTRRVHGLQLPLNPLQVVGWVVFLITTFFTFYFVVPSLNATRIIITIPLIILYAIHLVAHVTALILDPAELELRKLDINTLPEFDRTKHEHVIENGRCHLCNIQTSSLKTKHCSICNKCVDKFDHHCKWLNHCIGKRNYVAFFISVITAAFLAFIVTIISITEITIYCYNPNWLSWPRNFQINKTNSLSVEAYSGQYKTDALYLSILVIFSIITLTLGCFLLHLCLFHIYISAIGMTTYEYIRNNEETSPTVHCTFDKLNMSCWCFANDGCLSKILHALDWKTRKRKNCSNICCKISKVGVMTTDQSESKTSREQGLKSLSGSIIGNHHLTNIAS